MQKIGFTREKELIDQRWQEFIAMSGSASKPEYDRCYPNDLLESLAQHAYKGVDSMGCRIATPETSDPIYLALNEAWVEFWKDPQNYAAWERKAVEKLWVLCSGGNS